MSANSFCLPIDLLANSLRHAIAIVNEKALLPEYKYLVLVSHNGTLYARAESEMFKYQANLGPINSEVLVAFNPRTLQAIIDKKNHHSARISIAESEIIFSSGDVSCRTTKEQIVFDDDISEVKLQHSAPLDRYVEYALTCLQNIIGRPDLSHAKFIFSDTDNSILSLNTNQLMLYCERNETQFRNKVFSMSQDTATFIKKFSDSNPLLGFENESYIVESQNWRIISPRIKIKTPNFQNAIPTGDATIIFGDLKKLREILKTLAKAKAIGLIIEGISGCFYIEGIGKKGNIVFSEQLNWKFGGVVKPIRYGLELKLFSKIIQPIRGSDIMLYVKGPLDACAIKSNSDSGYYASNMPMRL